MEADFFTLALILFNLVLFSFIFYNSILFSFQSKKILENQKEIEMVSHSLKDHSHSHLIFFHFNKKKKYKKSEILKHNKINDLWIIVENEVYDVTNYVDIHPGGQKSVNK